VEVTLSPLTIRGCPVHPAETVKVLGVVLDQQLRFKHHTARTAKRGLRAAMALRRLRSLRASTARQLFTATVAPVVDYASFVWSTRLTNAMTNLLLPIQRLAAQAIVGTFRTVALPVAEAEAAIEPLQSRWQHQSLRTWISLHTLPTKHPFWKSRRRIDITNKRFVSPLQVHAQRWERVNVNRVETIRPYCVPPWYDRAEIEIQGHDKAIEATQNQTGTLQFYTDGSVRNDLVGVAVWCRKGSRNECIGSSQDLSVCFAELFAIWRVVQAIEIHADSHQDFHSKHFIIRSDSQAALKSLAHPRQQSGQHIVISILEAIQRLRTLRVRITLIWVPAHTGIEGNEAAHSLAHEATAAGRTPLITAIPRLKSSTLHCARSEVLKPMTKPSDHSHFAKQIDQALPGKHTRLLYNSLIKSDARILVQLRTGKCRLKGYLARINVEASD
jgi:ribonuclease HI